MPPLTHSATMHNGQVGVCTLQHNWLPYGSALGWEPIQFISLRSRRKCAHCPMKRKMWVFKLQILKKIQCWNRRIEIRHQTQTRSVFLPAGQQTSSFPPPCTQFPPAGWPTWPVRRAGSLGWHHTVDVTKQTNLVSTLCSLTEVTVSASDSK